jgi:hypothetical protein
LEFAINNQHMNGGLAVDIWGQTTLDGCYAVGEAAGTHGVTRPGGAALNAGQVLATRCAEHIASRGEVETARASEQDLIEDALRLILDVLQPESPIATGAVKAEVQSRMSDHAGIVCNAHNLKKALAGARALNGSIRRHGVSYEGAYEAARALQWQQMALVSETVLTALDFYVDRGGGSRGARAVCSPEGHEVPLARTGPLEDFRFLAERAEDRTEQILIRLDNQSFAIRTRAVSAREPARRAFFERDWPDFLTGAIFDRPADLHPANAAKRL